MPRLSLKSLAALIRPHVRRPGKAKPSVKKYSPRMKRRRPPRFAPIRLEAASSDGQSGRTPFAAAFELVFSDGLALRVARDADPTALVHLVASLRRQGE